MEFITSKKEITRRKKAFATLLVSITLGLFLSSLFFNYQILIYEYLLIVAAFLFLIVTSFHFLNSLLKLKLSISEKEIKKTGGKLPETFLLSDIKSLKIKRRTNGIIREIYLSFDKRKELVITAFEDDFENIKNLLISKANSGVLLKEKKELLDFDHPVFYSILGLPISLAGFLFLKLITDSEYYQKKYIFFALSVYVLAIGIYFFVKKPMSIRSERKQAIADYIFGLIIVCGSIFIFLVGLSL